MKGFDKIPAKLIRATHALKHKAGSGDIPISVIQKAEIVVKENSEDFLPLAEGFLARLAKGVEEARLRQKPMEDLIAGMTKPVMELKANAKMFRYELVTNLAKIMLDFLESIRELDDSAIDIVAAHHKTLSAIITKKMAGGGGHIGPVLEKELQGVIQRYFAQKKTVT